VSFFGNLYRISFVGEAKNNNTMNRKISFKSQIFALALFTSVALSTTSCKKDKLEETSLEASPTAGLPNEVKTDIVSADGITSSSYYLVNSLPSGYVKDGSKDYTSYVQAAVTKYSNIVFPGFPILVNDEGINIGSNKTITFEKGSEIRLKGTSKGTYSVFRILSASNVNLYNPVVVGDRYSHIGTSGEWGMGIGIWGSSNVNIYNANITNCWGDGIYIGQAGGKINSKDIVIKDAYLRKNRRDGISIIAVDGLLLDNLYAGYTDGTSPMSGINIEPNNTYAEVKNVRINNPRTENNGKNGIQIGLKNMLGSANKYVDITITNHFDTGSPRYAFKVACNPTDQSGKMYGLIDIVNPAWHKTSTETNLYLWLSSNQSNLKTSVSSPEIMTTSGSILSWTDTYNSVMKAARGGVVSVTNSTSSIVSPETAVTGSEANNVVFAVNSGGTSFKAANGITYSADKSYSGGSLYKTSNAITNTSDDVLYQTERYGKTFSYAIPVTDGTYEITFKTSENYHKASGKRKFDILAENKEIAANLDIYAVAGFNKAYDIVKTVTVTDGTLNINFRTDLDQAKISAFHIVRK
jgi:hypothetical protein